jgi:hypothetical protein
MIPIQFGVELASIQRLRIASGVVRTGLKTIFTGMFGLSERAWEMI